MHPTGWDANGTSLLSFSNSGEGGMRQVLKEVQDVAHQCVVFVIYHCLCHIPYATRPAFAAHLAFTPPLAVCVRASSDADPTRVRLTFPASGLHSDNTRASVATC